MFVGGRFTGDLAASGTLTLTRPDGSTADAVDLRRRRLAGPDRRAVARADQPDRGQLRRANWALSTGRARPGAANGGPVVTAPGAPTIGTATAGNASATVTLDRPGQQRRLADHRLLGPGGQHAPAHQVGALRPAGAGATSLVVTGLTNGTGYRFQVAATNSVGTGAFSALSNVVTPTSGPACPGLR